MEHKHILSKEPCLSIINRASGDTKLFIQLLFFLRLRISECRCLKRENITERDGGCLVFSISEKGVSVVALKCVQRPLIYSKIYFYHAQDSYSQVEMEALYHTVEPLKEFLGL